MVRRKPRFVRLWYLAAFLVVLQPAGARGQNLEYALVGTVVAPGGILENGTVLVSDGAIRAVGIDIALPAGVPVIRTDGVIFAGLIDLHNHLVWNVLPRWKPLGPVGNRYDWQAMDDYKKKLSGPEQKLIDRGAGCDMERYAEVKALLGGATSLAGSFSPTDADPTRNACDRGLARNLDFASGLYSQTVNAEPLEYDVFPFELSVSKGAGCSRQLVFWKIKSRIVSCC